jgi:hypothetical protein
MSFVECILPNKWQYFFTIPSKQMNGFPKQITSVELICKGKPYEVTFYVDKSHHGFSCLRKMWDVEQLKKDGTIRVYILQEEKQYRLEIVK